MKFKKFLKNCFINYRFINGFIIRMSFLILFQKYEKEFREFTFLENNIKSPSFIITNGLFLIKKLINPYIFLENYHENFLLSIFYIFNLLNSNITKFINILFDIIISLQIELFLTLKENNKLKNKKSICFILYNFYKSDKYCYHSILYLFNPIIIYLNIIGLSDCFLFSLFLFILILIEINLFYLSAILYGILIQCKLYTIINLHIIYVYIIFKYNKVDNNIKIQNFYKKENLKKIFKYFICYQANFFMMIFVQSFLINIFITFCLFGSSFLYKYFFYNFFNYSYYISNHLSISIYSYPLSMISYTLLYNIFFLLINLKEIFILYIIRFLFFYKNFVATLLINTLIHFSFYKEINIFQIYWIFALFSLKKITIKFINYIILEIFLFILKIIIIYKIDFLGENYLLQNWYINCFIFILHCILIYNILNEEKNVNNNNNINNNLKNEM